MTKRDNDRNVNRQHGIIDIDDLPNEVSKEIKTMLKGFGIGDFYSGDVLAMCKVVNQAIRRNQQQMLSIKSSIQNLATQFEVFEH